MSASDKKKLRKEQESAFITEKQHKEQKEAKKLKIYTIAFVSVMALVVCIALVSLVVRGVTQSGVFERNTLAVSVDGKELNTVEFNYYFHDAINEMYNNAYNQYQTYYELYFESMGLDVTKPLDEQVHKGDKDGKTWADFFVDSALESLKSDYTMVKMAKEEGFTLSEEKQKEISTTLSNVETTAALYGYSNAKQYLQIIYGYGADLDSYGEYLKQTTLADAFYSNYYDKLDFDDEAIREYEKDKVADWNSYTYHSAYLSYTEFLPNKDKDAEDTEYTEDEKNAAKEALKKAAESLATAESLEKLKEMAKDVPVNENSEVAVNKQTNQLHSAINATVSKWLAAEERKEGDIAALANIATDAKDGELANGYYVVYFESRTDNKTPVGNVRHLLVEFEGGEPNEETGDIVYSVEEKKTAKDEADKYLKQWQDGEATEESFIDLVKKHSDDTSAEEGGLFEDITPASQYVAEFRDWATDASRKAGDVEVIESQYGYHVMYYVGASELNYRDHMISMEMKTEAQTKWYEAALKDITTTKLDLSYVPTDMTISNS